LIYLDTHIIVWLYGGQIERLSSKAKNLINENEIYISPIVSLELQYLFEIERIAQKSQTVLQSLSETIGLKVCEKNFYQIVKYAQQFAWTRDPFDRIIAAQAALDANTLVTKDQNLLTHFKLAVW